MSNSTSMKNLKSKIDENNQITINANDSRFANISFFAKRFDLSDERIRNTFIKSVERLVRTNGVYKAYIAYLKDEIGLTKCAMFGNIDHDKADIEMHHTLLTLYDYVEITIVYFIKNNLNISTFEIAKQILEDHTKNLILITPLSKMAHEAVHINSKSLKPEFIDLSSSFGDLKGYLIKYENCIPAKTLNKINRYLEEYEQRKAENSEIFTDSVINYNNDFSKKLANLSNNK